MMEASDDEEDEEAAALFQEMLNNISLEDSHSGDEDEAAALFQEMLNNISFEDTYGDNGSADNDPFRLLDDSLLDEDASSNLPHQALNIQLMGCRKMAAAFEMVHKRRSLSR